jgi:erythromycin esterase-like protein
MKTVPVADRDRFGGFAFVLRQLDQTRQVAAAGFTGLDVPLNSASTPLGALAQDSALSALLAANRHSIALSDGRATGVGAELLVAGAAAARFFLIGEEHGVAQAPQLVQALLAQLRPRGYNTFAIEVSPLQGQRLDALTRTSDRDARLDTLLSSWLTTVPFYGLAEERALLKSTLHSSGSMPPMRIWGLDYDINGDRLFLAELARLAPASGRAAVERAIALADRGFAAFESRGDPSQLFAWSAPDSVFTALRSAFGQRVPARATAIIDLFETTARINRLFLSGRGYESNLMRSAFLRRNFVTAWDAALRAGAPPKVIFKFGGSHMMRGLNYTHTLDIGSAAAVVAEARGERAYSVLILGGSGTKSARLNPVRGQYEPIGTAEVDADNLAWLLPALPASEWVVFDMLPVRAAYLRRRQALTVEQDRFFHAYDAIVVLQGSTPGTSQPSAPR